MTSNDKSDGLALVELFFATGEKMFAENIDSLDVPHNGKVIRFVKNGSIVTMLGEVSN